MKEQTIEEKKAYLRSYIQLKREAISKAELIDYLRQAELGRAVNYSDMPKAGSSQRDLSDYAAKYDEAVTELQEANRKMFERMSEIIQAIDDMPADTPAAITERAILRKRYILGYGWEMIAVQIGKTYRHTTRMHGYALEHFWIPERKK